jgi:hypothetical protein
MYFAIAYHYCAVNIQINHRIYAVPTILFHRNEAPKLFTKALLGDLLSLPVQ